MKLRKKEADEQKAKAKRDKLMIQAQQRDYMRTYVKSQSSALYNNAWTRKQVWALSDEQLVLQYNRIKSRCEKDGMSAPKLVPTIPADDAEPSSQKVQLEEAVSFHVPAWSPSFSADVVSTMDVDVPVVDQVSLPDTSAGVTTFVASSGVDKGKAKVVAEALPSRKRTRK